MKDYINNTQLNQLLKIVKEQITKKWLELIHVFSYI